MQLILTEFPIKKKLNLLFKDYEKKMSQIKDKGLF